MRLKRLELWWRRLWIKGLTRLMRQPATGRPDWNARQMRVLFLRHDRAGDMILSTGVMRAIANSYPTITLDVLASPINAGLVQGADYLSDVVVFDKKRLASYIQTIRRLRGAHYDAVIDCMVTAPSLTTLLLILASGARYRVGIAGRGNDSAFNITVPGENEPGTHMADRLAALARAFDVELDAIAKQPRLHLTPDERDWAAAVWGDTDGERILINISAGTADRRWPSDRYVAVMNHLRGRAPSATMLVISAPTETERGEQIARDGGGTFVRTKSLRHAVALVALSDFVFTPDTSIAHAASAFQRPAVAMYRTGTSAGWALYGTTGASIEHAGAFADLGLDRVLPEIDRIWDEALSRRD